MDNDEYIKAESFINDFKHSDAGRALQADAKKKSEFQAQCYACFKDLDPRAFSAKAKGAN